MFAEPFFIEINDKDSLDSYVESSGLLCGNWPNTLSKKRLSMTTRNAERHAEDLTGDDYLQRLMGNAEAVVPLGSLLEGSLAEELPQNSLPEILEQQLPQSPIQEEDSDPAIPKRNRGFEALNITLPQQFDPKITPKPPLLPLTGNYPWGYREKKREKKKPKEYLPELSHPIIDKKDRDKDPDSGEQRGQVNQPSYRDSGPNYYKQASSSGNYNGNYNSYGRKQALYSVEYSYRSTQLVSQDANLDNDKTSTVLYEANVHGGTLAVLGLGVYNKLKLSHSLYIKLSTYAIATQWLDYIGPDVAGCTVGAVCLFIGSSLVKSALVSMGIKLAAPQIAAQIIQYQYRTLLVNLKTYGGVLNTLKLLGKI